MMLGHPFTLASDFILLAAITTLAGFIFITMAGQAEGLDC
jgi:hypothetical protein